jgi:hypothetical protein
MFTEDAMKGVRNEASVETISAGFLSSMNNNIRKPLPRFNLAIAPPDMARPR